MRSQEVWQAISQVLALEAEEITLEQMAVRAFVIYIVALIMIRLGKKRFIGRSTAFDVILAIMLGSILSRAITGNSPFFPTIGAGFLLIGLHWFFAAIAFHFNYFGTLIKGRTRKLVENGEILWDVMNKSQISENDLFEALRSQGISDLNKVKMACLERNGNISVIPADTKPEILEVGAAEGIQTVRIQLEHYDLSQREKQLEAYIVELERKVGQLAMLIEKDLK